MLTSILYVNSNIKVFYAEDRGLAMLNSKSKGRKFYKEVIIDAVDPGVIITDVTALTDDEDKIHITYREFNDPDYSVKYKVGTVDNVGNITWDATETIFTSTTEINQVRSIVINNVCVIFYQHDNKIYTLHEDTTKTLVDTLLTKDNIRVVSDYDDNIYVFYKSDNTTINYVKWTVVLATWSQPFTVLTDVLTGDNRFDVAITVTGNFYLVYANETNCRLLKSVNGTTWVRVSADNIMSSSDVYYPMVHLDCDDNINLFISKKIGDVTKTDFIYSENGLLYTDPVEIKRFNDSEHSIEEAIISSVVTVGDALNCSYLEHNEETDTLHVIYFKIVDSTYTPYSAITVTEVPITPHFMPKTLKGTNLQPNIVEAADGTLYIYSYDKMYKRVLYRYSLDEGNSWTDDFVAFELTQLSTINHLKVIMNQNDTYAFYSSGGRLFMKMLGQFAEEWSSDHMITLDAIATSSYVGGDKEKSWDVVLYDNGTISKFVLAMYRKDLDTSLDYINISAIALADIDLDTSTVNFVPTLEFQINEDAEYLVSRRVGVSASISTDTAPTSNDWGIAIAYTDSYPLGIDYESPVQNNFRTKVMYKTITEATVVTTKTLYDHWVNNELPLSQYTISPSICTSTFSGSEVHSVGYVIPRTKADVIPTRTTSTELVVYGNTIPTDTYSTDTVSREMIVGDSAINLEQLYLSRCVVVPVSDDTKNSAYIAAGVHTSIFGNTGVAYLAINNLELDTDATPDKLYQNPSDKIITSVVGVSNYIDTADSCIGTLTDSSGNLHICIAQALNGKASLVYSKWLGNDLPDVNYHHNMFPTPIMVFDE